MRGSLCGLRLPISPASLTIGCSPGLLSADQVAERVIVDRLLRALPRTQRRPVSMRNHLDIAELVEAIELAEASIARDNGERAGLAPRRVMKWRLLEGIRPSGKQANSPQGYRCAHAQQAPGPPCSHVDGQLYSSSCGPHRSPRLVSESRQQDNISSA